VIAPAKLLGLVVLEIARHELDKRMATVDRIQEKLERVEKAGDPSQIAKGAVVLMRARREMIAWTSACESAARRYASQLDAEALENAWAFTSGEASP
jgi:hypothetical protein